DRSHRKKNRPTIFRIRRQRAFAPAKPNRLKPEAAKMSQPLSFRAKRHNGFSFHARSACCAAQSRNPSRFAFTFFSGALPQTTGSGAAPQRFSMTEFIQLP